MLHVYSYIVFLLLYDLLWHVLYILVNIDQDQMKLYIIVHVNIT